MFSLCIIGILGISLKVVLCLDSSVKEVACGTSELPCESTGCIPKGRWCNNFPDCEDHSDEMLCALPGHSPKCLEHHFRCDDGTCIPILGRCDQYPDCHDHSDENEDLCRNITVLRTNASVKKPRSLPVPTFKEIKKAENWILSERNENYGWGQDTARAIVALYLTDKQRYEGTKEGDLMMKQLNIQIMTDIARNSTYKMSLSKVASYVNSLLATCQSPKAFQGLDLTRKLRYRADQLKRSNGTVPPLVLLTLCLTGELNSNDVTHLYNKYFAVPPSQQKLDLYAVALMAMSCMLQETSLRRSQKSSDERLTLSLAHRLAKQYEANGNEKDVYTTALVIQALNAAKLENWDESAAMRKLLNFQNPNGSFGGDVLATYYALPALSKKSLISLKNIECNMEHYGHNLIVRPSRREQKEIRYSLWIDNPVTGSHTMSLKIDANWTMFDVMIHAAEMDDLFRFHYEKTQSGLSIYSISNIPNDSERELKWTSYKSSEANSDHYKHRNIPFDLRSKPDNGDHVIMWYRSSRDQQ